MNASGGYNELNQRMYAKIYSSEKLNATMWLHQTFKIFKEIYKNCLTM